MISYRRYRRENQGDPDATLTNWLRGTRYQLWSRLIHALGLHGWRTRFHGGRHCDWCGATRPR